MKPIIYAATDATFISVDSRKFWSPPETFTQAGKSYRRLTPEYWAWFNHKYGVMEKALINGKISENTFEEILDRIAAVYYQAHFIYGRDALKAAEKAFDLEKWERKTGKGRTDNQNVNSYRRKRTGSGIVVSRSRGIR